MQSLWKGLGSSQAPDSMVRPSGSESLDMVERAVCVHSGQMGTLRLQEGRGVPGVSLEEVSIQLGVPASALHSLPSRFSQTVGSSSFTKGSVCGLEKWAPPVHYRGVCVNCQLPAGSATAARGVTAHGAVLTSDGRGSESLTSLRSSPCLSWCSSLILVLSSLPSSQFTLLDQCSAPSPDLHPFFPIRALLFLLPWLGDEPWPSSGAAALPALPLGPRRWLSLPVHTSVLLSPSLELSQLPHPRGVL